MKPTQWEKGLYATFILVNLTRTHFSTDLSRIWPFIRVEHPTGEHQLVERVANTQRMSKSQASCHTCQEVTGRHVDVRGCAEGHYLPHDDTKGPHVSLKEKRKIYLTSFHEKLYNLHNDIL